ncbi:restin homolog [Aricia agestis]|uniref:restin homolog n=1 Tax=Aricia agestis TaxID=91739 RepID=UPI001C20357F|nr:restin homolog [Aricia agestis]
MSETDDTDVLLNIPPNFFNVKSSDSEDSFINSSRTVLHKPVSCTARVLGKLVDQVHTLESRLEDLELDNSINSTAKSLKYNTWNNISCDSRSVDREYFTFPRRRRRKVRKARSGERDVPSDWRTVSTLERSKRDTPSMDGDISSIISTPSKKNDRLLLNEIDEFLNKVESYESPESIYRRESSINTNDVIKATGDYITDKLDPSTEVKLPSGRMVPANILDKYIYLVKNNQGQASNSDYDTNEKSNSISRLNFTENKDVQTTSTPKRTKEGANFSDSFKPSSNKIYDRASMVLEQYKSQNSSNNNKTSLQDSIKKEEFKMPQIRPFVDNDGLKMTAMQVDTIDTDLLSLSELWGERGENVERADSIKLEEERLKREHCEVTIQQLQKKILDQQEKLAVAMKVDKAKDTAISKLREAWLRLTNSLSRAEERHKAALDKMVREVENFKNVADDSQKKTNHFEKELYKALDLAHDYQEKCKQINNEKVELQEHTEKMLAEKEDEILTKQNEIESLRENYETVMKMNKHSTEYVSNLEEAMEKEKRSHEETKHKMRELQSKMESLDEERILAEQERDIVKEKVNEERSRCSILERQLCDSQNQVGELLKKCDILDNEAKTLRKHLELQKTELKSHYQQQVEEAVLGKLQEFQHQLDLAQRDMDEAARVREAAVVDGYNKQIARIEEQHRLEVNVLEEKQREEIKLYRLQLAQASEKIALLESKVESWKKRRGEMAAQLHGVMQAQWTQALRILTRPQQHDTADSHATQHGKFAQHGQYAQHGNTAQHGQFAQHGQYAQHGNSAQHGQSAHAQHGQYAHTAQNAYAQARQLAQDNRYLDSTHDTAATGAFPEFELSSALSVDRDSDTDLQRYIRQLLTKKPSFSPLETSPEKAGVEEPTSDRNDRRARRNTAKPPWKA